MPPRRTKRKEGGWEGAAVGGRGGGWRSWEEEKRGQDIGRAEMEEVATVGIGRSSSRLRIRTTHTHLLSIPDRTTNSRRGWQPLPRRHTPITPLRRIPCDTR